MCLVAYSDGKQVQGFQLVLLSTPNDNLLNLFTVSRVLTMSEIRLPIPARNGRRGHTKILKIGQWNNSDLMNWIRMMKLRFRYSCKRPKISNSRGTKVANSFCLQFRNLRPFVRNRGSLGAISERFIVSLFISQSFLLSELKHRRFHRESKGSFSIHVGFERSTTDIFSALCPRWIYFERSWSSEDLSNWDIIPTPTEKTIQRTDMLQSPQVSTSSRSGKKVIRKGKG